MDIGYRLIVFVIFAFCFNFIKKYPAVFAGSDYYIVDFIQGAGAPHSFRKWHFFHDAPKDIGKFYCEMDKREQEMIDCDEIKYVNDRPILWAAIEAKVDILLAGDKDFPESEDGRPYFPTHSGTVTLPRPHLRKTLQPSYILDVPYPDSKNLYPPSK